MKIMASCSVCIEEVLKKAKKGEHFPLPMLNGEIDDTGIIRARCVKGHDSLFTTIHPKHEILFNSGCKALIDGYTNESVATIASALERSYEFFIRVAFRKWGRNKGNFEAVWKKEVSSSSERQYGVFVFVYLHLTGDEFSEPQIIREFRNKVVHKGIIVNQDETQKYVDAVFLLIRNTVSALKKHCDKQYFDEMNELQEKQKHLVRGKTSSSYRGLSIDSFSNDSLSDYLKELNK